jgi:hypothetical protein
MKFINIKSFFALLMASLTCVVLFAFYNGNTPTQKAKIENINLEIVK